MRYVFAFVAGAAVAGLLMSWALAPAPCQCPDAECMIGPFEFAPPPVRRAVEPGTYLL